MLDLCYLRQNYHLLLQFMKEGDYKYCDDYINKVRREIEKLLSVDIQFDSYEDYYLYRIKDDSVSENSRKAIKYLLNLIMNFDLYRTYPSGTHNKHRLFENENSIKLSDEFQSLLNYFEEAVNHFKKSDDTCRCEYLILRSFLLTMQNNNIFTLSDIEEKNVISHFMNDNREIIRGYGTCRRLKRALITVSTGFNECNRIIGLIPELKETEKNIQYLTDNEISVIRDVIINGHKDVSYKGRAILSLLLYLFLRSVDIAGLKLCDIDWDNEIIHINQSKTKNPFDMPLIPIVGNQLSNYLLYERPSLSESEYVFVQHRLINCKLSSDSVQSYVSRIMIKIGIRCNKEDRKGTHIFRHYNATKMIENDVSAPVVSASLGHSSPKSLKHYVSTDFKHLKECSLSIEKFPFCGCEGGDING